MMRLKFKCQHAYQSNGSQLVLLIAECLYANPESQETVVLMTVTGNEITYRTGDEYFVEIRRAMP